MIRNAIRYGNTGQTGAAIKRIVPNVRNAVRYSYTGNVCFVMKCLIANADYRHIVYKIRDYNRSAGTSIAGDLNHIV